MDSPGQERIIEKREGEGTWNDHAFIKIQIFTHAGRVTNFSCTYDTYIIGCGLRDNCLLIIIPSEAKFLLGILSNVYGFA